MNKLRRKNLKTVMLYFEVRAMSDFFYGDSSVTMKPGIVVSALILYLRHLIVMICYHDVIESWRKNAERKFF